MVCRKVKGTKIQGWNLFLRDSVVLFKVILEGHTHHFGSKANEFCGGKKTGCFSGAPLIPALQGLWSLVRKAFWQVGAIVGLVGWLVGWLFTI